jgi:signal transduction histidine kinase
MPNLISMTTRSGPAGVLATLLGDVRDAAVRAPVLAPRGWRWRPGRVWKVLGAAIWVVLAGGFTGGAIGQMAAGMGVPGSVAAALGLVQATPLVLAGRWPLAAWRVMVVGLLAGVFALSGQHQFWPWPVTSWLAMVAVLIQVAAGYPRSIAVGAGVVTALGAVLPAVVFARMPFWFALILWAIIALVLVLADALTGRYAAEASLAEQTALRQRDLARQAVLEERTRIARELHDVVAHHMSVVALQAEAAPYKLADLSPAAKQAFEVLRDAAREALAETRRVVGLLRDDDEAAERLPQPGLDRLDELLDRARDAGLVVESRVIGVPRPIPAGVDLSAYRIAQEALSNAARYAPGSTVRAEIRYAADRLTVRVADDGAKSGVVVSDPGGGHGLVGMRERVTMLGGSLSAAPVADGGFEVTAELPYARTEP